MFTVSGKISLKARVPTAAAIVKGPKYLADNFDESPGESWFFPCSQQHLVPHLERVVSSLSICIKFLPLLCRGKIRFGTL
jgi:hypothetical protein